VDLDRELRSLLWPGADIVVSYDEVHALFDTPALFFGLTAVNVSTGAEAPATPVVAGAGASAGAGAEADATTLRRDCFHGLLAVMADLTDRYAWVQSMCGTWLRIAQEVTQPAPSPLHDRVTTVFHASFIDEAAMWESLNSFLWLDEAAEDAAEAAAAAGLPHCCHCVPQSAAFGSSCDDAACTGACRGCGGIRSRLRQLAGRPVFFFDFVLGPLWTRLTETWLHLAPRAVDAAALRGLVLRSLDAGIRTSRNLFNNAVDEL
jgi:hypothetical protein